MPIYEYECKKCKHVFEKIKSSSRQDQLEQCPECNHESRNIIAASNFRLKGDGWYKASQSQND